MSHPVSQSKFSTVIVRIGAYTLPGLPANGRQLPVSLRSMSTGTSVLFRIPPCHFATHAGHWRLLAVMSRLTRMFADVCGVFLRIITVFRAALAVAADRATP